VTQPLPGEKILLINIHASENAGDAAGLEMCIKGLESAFPQATITVPMNKPDMRYQERDPERVRILPSIGAHCGSDRDQRRFGRQIWELFRLLVISLPAAFWHRRWRRLPPWTPEDWRELLLSYAEADLVVSCSGNIFAMTARWGLPFVIAAYTVAYALLLRKPFYVMPQSIGPFSSAWQGAILRRLYSRAGIVMLREPLSLRLARQIGLPAERLRLTADPAFALPTLAPDASSPYVQAITKHEGPRLGVTAINRLLRRVDADAWERYESALAHGLGNFIREFGGQVIFFPQVTGPSEREDDRVAARRIKERMENPQQVILLEEALSPSSLKGLYGMVDAFVATRMHSAIFALSMGVPTLFIEYLSKTRGLVEMLGQEEWCIDLTQITDDLFWSKLEALWEQRAEVRQEIAGVVPGMVADAARVGQVVAEAHRDA
jgi:colanic acid/amylovoran biosynthesis protein WcaK/AmsJ